MSDSDDEDEIQDPSPAPIVRRRGEKTGPKARISESDAMQLVRPLERAIRREREEERRASREAKIIELVGHDGDGGRIKNLEDDMKALAKDVEELKLFKVKTMMLFTVATTVGGAVAAVVALVLDKLL